MVLDDFQDIKKPNHIRNRDLSSKITMKKIIFFFTILFQNMFISVYSQTVKPNFIGERHVIDSEILKEKREISIYLPENYEGSATDYPVLYILDGQRYFLNGILYQNTLKWQEKTPDFIVVGVNTNNRKRRQLFLDDAKLFIDFLDKELIPYLDKDYRTSSKRYFFGWEMAGGLAIELLTQPIDMFSAYFIASPTHITNKRLRALSEKLISNANTKAFLYFALSPSEDWAMESVVELKKILEENLSHNVNWKYESLKDENHHSTPTLTMHKGLNAYFHDYPYVRFKTLDEFNTFGGMPSLKAHYQKRGEKYNTSKGIHKSTKHFLFLQAMKEDDFKSFEFFMEEFKDYYKSKTRDLWFNRYAQFYLRHQKPNEAMEILNAGLGKFQDSSLIMGSLGDTFMQKRDKKMAKEYYKKAIDLASKNGDKNIEAYKAKWKQI